MATGNPTSTKNSTNGNKVQLHSQSNILRVGTGNTRANDWPTGQSEGTNVPPTCDKTYFTRGKMISNYYVKKVKANWGGGKTPKPNFVIILLLNV